MLRFGSLSCRFHAMLILSGIRNFLQKVKGVGYNLALESGDYTLLQFNYIWTENKIALGKILAPYERLHGKGKSKSFILFLFFSWLGP